MSISTTTDPWRGALGTLGGAFMTSTEIGERSKTANMPRSALYFRGRAGIMGDLTRHSAQQILAIFPERLVHQMWSRSSEVSAATAVRAYLDACHEWGRVHLEESGDLEHLAGDLSAVVRRAEPTALPLATAWQQVRVPDEPREAVAHCAMVVREIRGGLHFAALALVNLPIDRAILVDSSGGTKRLQKLGWDEEEIASLKSRRQDGDRERWREAEAATEAAFVGLVAEVLGEDGVVRLGERLLRLDVR